MSDLIPTDKDKAQTLFDAALELESEGDTEGAIAQYKLSIEADPERSESYYNLGFIYKYRNDWPNALKYNRIAYELAPDDEAARWNMAIAATGMRDWNTARRAWADQGIKFNSDAGEIHSDFGQTPVRLNPDGDNAEVVWARRIDPVRARIENIPLPKSGFRCGDVVLHDGAAVGYRMLGDSERPVFNVMELFEPSRFSTFGLKIDLDSPESAEKFLEMFRPVNIDVEDWTANYQVLCKQCSEGRPHEQHDHHGTQEEAGWQVRRHIGIAAVSASEIEAVLAGWTGSGKATMQLTCELAAR